MKAHKLQFSSDQACAHHSTAPTSRQRSGQITDSMNLLFRSRHCQNCNWKLLTFLSRKTLARRKMNLIRSHLRKRNRCWPNHSKITWSQLLILSWIWIIVVFLRQTALHLLILSSHQVHLITHAPRKVAYLAVMTQRSWRPNMLNILMKPALENASMLKNLNSKAHGQWLLNAWKVA